MHPLDTSDDAAEAQRAVWRALGPAGRVALALRMSDEVREIARAGIRHRHPEYDEDAVRWALYRLCLGDALFHAAFPAAPVLPA